MTAIAEVLHFSFDHTPYRFALFRIRLIYCHFIYELTPTAEVLKFIDRDDIPKHGMQNYKYVLLGVVLNI